MADHAAGRMLQIYCTYTPTRLHPTRLHTYIMDSCSIQAA